MNMPKMRGGFTVTNPITGTYLIQDIHITVPHQVAVYIPADKAYKSKDLWRAVGQGRLFQLTGGSGLAVEPPVKPGPDKDAALEGAHAENRQLKHQLGESQRQKIALQETIQSMQGQLNAILGALGRIENAPAAVIPMQGAAQAQGVSPLVEAPVAVGGDTPAFIPDGIKPDNAESNIRVEAEISTATVADSISTLRKLRKKGKD